MNKPSRFPPGIPHCIEVLISLTGLLLTSPLLLIAMACVGLTSKGPVLFVQARMGRGGVPFSLVKLRTMKIQDPGPNITSAGDARITPVGRILRKTKIDELPELWNIVKGEMSLVGPRPEVPQHVDLRDPLWGAVLSVRPGITDPVTLFLRNEEELMASVKGDRHRFYETHLQPLKLRGYVQYLESRSPGRDLRVLSRSVISVLFSSRKAPPTLEEFSRKVEENVLYD